MDKTSTSWERWITINKSIFHGRYEFLKLSVKYFHEYFMDLMKYSIFNPQEHFSNSKDHSRDSNGQKRPQIILEDQLLMRLNQ